MLVVIHHALDVLNGVTAGQKKRLNLHPDHRAILHVAKAAADLHLLEREAERRLRDLLGVDEDLYASVVNDPVPAAPAVAPVATAAAAAPPAATAFPWTAVAAAAGAAAAPAAAALARATSCLHDAAARLRCVLGTLEVCGFRRLFVLRQRSPAKASPRAAGFRRRMDVHNEVDPCVRDDAPTERIDLNPTPSQNRATEG